jgi:hypothetical protein
LWAPLCSALQAVEIIGGLLRVAGGVEDRPLVVFQDFEPGRDIGGVVVAGFRRDAKDRRIKKLRRFPRRAPPWRNPPARPGQIELDGCRPEEAEQGIGVGAGGRLVLLQFVEVAMSGKVRVGYRSRDRKLRLSTDQ